MSYIENVYYINRNTMTLDPIEIDKYDKTNIKHCYLTDELINLNFIKENDNK